MSDKAEDDLIALVASEQRGFRRILFAGLAVLIVLVAMSAALGVYYFNASNALSETSDRLQREAFDTRIRMDQQNNRVAAQEGAIRRAYEDFRVANGATGAGAQQVPALEAVRAYVQRGRHALADERLIEAAAEGPDGASATHWVFVGAAALLAWERGGEQIQRGATALPERLLTAEQAFAKALTDPALAPLAHNGIAWVRFINASSQRSNFAQRDCEAVLQAVTAGAAGGRPGPQPLYWQAQCERKLGRTREALRDYALALAESGDGAGASPDASEMTLAMNAYHGMGTVLVAAFAAPDDAEMRAAIDLATRACGRGVETTGTPRARLALACLDQAIRLRQRLRQTDNSVSGTAENKGFAYLRDGDFERAFANATAVERTGLFAWNELVRALSAAHIATPAAFRARREALRNVSFFRVSQFNVCELGVLLDPALFEEARGLIAGQHKGEKVACP